jgi:putative hemolysin|tara:strand:- start:1448 stop:2398 length:951 start_codon:yes stop_codon:yes gene_type:complete
MDVLILIALIVLNGVFAMSEIAIVTAKKSRLAALAGKGRASANVALRMAENPTQFLSTVQIGITSIGIMNGIFGESVLAEPFAQWLHQIGMSASTSSTVATVFVVVVITYVTIVIGELVPKRIGQVSAEVIACVVAPPMSWLAVAAKPFVILLSYSTQGLLRILRFRQTDGGMVTEEDIHALLQEGSTSGVIEHGEHAMVRNVLRLDERPITSLMVPRGNMIVLDVSLPLEDNYRRVLQSPHSAFPLWDRETGAAMGVVHAKEMLAQAVTGEAPDLLALAKPCHYVLENLTALKLLDYFKSADTQLVLVVDEYGVV